MILKLILDIDATSLLVLSISWSIFSSVRMHTKLTALEKGFASFCTEFLIFVWGTFAVLRRILSIVALFIPSMGLFSILHHWRWEQVPYKARLEYATRGFLTSEDKIALYGLNETFYWSELDRWNYSNPKDPQPPSYSIYTRMSLKETFIAGAALLVVHFIILLIVKVSLKTSTERKKSYFSMIILFLHFYYQGLDIIRV